jgi:hypothetical protein
MSVDSERVIELSRTKLVMGVAGSLLFVALGAWFFMADDDGSLLRTLGRFAPPWVFHALGAAAILFFGGCAVYAAVKSFDRTPGLVLGPEGLVDNSSAVAAGFIPWSEVTGVHVFELNRQKMLVLHVADPEKYIGRGNALQRTLNRANTSMCGSPIVISATALRISFPELHEEIASRLPARPIASGGQAGLPLHSP